MELPLDTARLAYAGEPAQPGRKAYVLGGRLYCPSMMRFLSPDLASPFDAGGLNRYAYCGGDPVSRVDPDGYAWWDWVAAGVGLIGAVVGTIATAGAFAGVLGAAAAGSLAASVSTASMTTMTMSAVLDVVAVAAEIGSLASMATGDTAVGSIFGWLALGAGATSTGLAGSLRIGRAAARSAHGPIRAPVEPPAGFRRLRTPVPDRSPVDRSVVRRTLVASPLEVPENRYAVSLDASGAANVRLRPAWVELSSQAFPGAVHFGADSAVHDMYLMAELRWIAQKPSSGGSIFFYTGAHGSPMGNNWNGATRRLADPAMFADDALAEPFLAALSKPHRLSIEDIGSMSAEEAARNFARPGLHVHAYCYGAVDEVLLQAFGIVDAVPVYDARLLSG